jgi:ferredoxin
LKKPVVNQEDCISCGLCAEVCPEVFRLNDKDLSEVHNPTGASEEKDSRGHRQLPGSMHPLGRMR